MLEAWSPASENVVGNGWAATGIGKKQKRTAATTTAQTRTMRAIFNRGNGRLGSEVRFSGPRDKRLWEPAQNGLHLALLGKRSFNDVELSSALNGQSLVALSRLCIRRRDCRGFVLGFTNGSDAEIEAAATQLVERARVC